MKEICEKISSLLQEKKTPVCVSIEGGSGSGKTTLAAALMRALPCNVYHMDDFFLPPEKRTAKRLLEAGGNVDYERFLAEVIEGVRAGRPFTYGVFDCKAGEITKAVHARACDLHIMEGVYSAHPVYAEIYDLRIFLDISPQKQRERIVQREGCNAKCFFDRWIPLENRYFEAFDIRGKSDMVIPIP